MAAILGNLRLDRGQFGDLVAPRVADVIARVQGPLTLPTRVGDEIDEVVHPLDRDQSARVTGMAGLSTRSAPTLRTAPAFTLPTSEAVGGRRFRARRRVLLPQGELPLQIRDAFHLLGNLPLALGEFPTQSLNLLLQLLLGVLARLPLRSRHAWQGTPIGSICTAP